MSVADFQDSVGHQVPVTLFEFTYGEGASDVLRLCNHDATVSFNGEDFTPTPISVDAIKNESREPGVPIVVTVKKQAPLTSIFGVVPANRVVLLKLYEGHVAGPGTPVGWQTDMFSLVWSGRVMTSEPTDGVLMKLNCDTLGAGMKRPMLRMSYSRECQHLLYGDLCQADKVAATTTHTVVSVTDRQIDLADGWADPFPPGNYIGGTVEWAGTLGPEIRTIVQAEQTYVVLDIPPTGVSGGDDVDLVLGCPLTFDGCVSLHNNAINYGGVRHIPKENPTGKNNHT